MTETIVDVVRRAAQAGHGGKAAVYSAACASLGLSLATLHRYMRAVAVAPERRRRSDAGQHNLTPQHAAMLSAALMEGYRANDKKLQSVHLALKRLRANNPGFAEVVRPDTGEIVPLGVKAVVTALRSYALHPDQLRRPPPATRQASLHPNDVWQIDASISTLFHVPEGQALSELHKAEFYKNKPDAVERVKPYLLTRYCITDHTSGAIFVHYVAGGESTVNMAESLLAAMQPRPGQPLHGVPFHLVMDPGSAGIAGGFKNLLRRLQIKPVVNKRRNPRAKGQVENAHNLVETDFESGFRFIDVPSLDWINDQAAHWMVFFNTHRVHTRHRTSRMAKWQEITPDQLRLVDAAIARTLLTAAPKTPTVDGFLQVRFEGKLWSLRDLAQEHRIMVGQKVAITCNPFNPDAAYLLLHDAQGDELLIDVPLATEGAHGFAAGAPLIGREFKGMPDTLADTNRKAIERLAMGAATDEAAAAARKAKALPFGGALNPYKHQADAPAVQWLPKRGTPLQPTAQVQAAPAQVLTLFEAAGELVRRGVVMNPERNAQVAQWHPDGVPEDALDDLVHRLSVRATLRVVGGAANE